MKYIDSEKLIAEIDNRIERCEECERDGYPDMTSSEATLKSFRVFIASLQQEQPEADLEKEIKLCWMNWLSPSNKKEVEGVLPKTEFEMYARHFYELGLNAKKDR